MVIGWCFEGRNVTDISRKKINDSKNYLNNVKLVSNWRGKSIMFNSDQNKNNSITI